MKLNQLFEIQKKLDDRIVKERSLEGRDLLAQKVLALLVELGELANEWQGFKMWKVNPQPKPKMLEEYVDCLHFFLSIGHELGKTAFSVYSVKSNSIIQQFKDIYRCVTLIQETIDSYPYTAAFKLFIGLGELLGFTWEQIEEAYIEKNKVNHKRQDEGY